MTQQVITRFAPSPTGYLHIGGARTALFNWLFARHYGGKMLLRIEDTDRERSTEHAVQAIFDGLKWLGLSWDDEVVFQFARADRHREIAQQLLAMGKAYKCYSSPEELEAMRERALKEGRTATYDGTWRDRPASDAPAGIAPVIRLKAPKEGETVIHDQVQGPVTFQNRDLDDFVLLRADGNPTYMLSVVVDDHDMAVTHIIRGDDHLTNAARQSQIYLAMGWDIPVFSHIPLIHGSDGKKLSKRHGALGADAYRALGYLPAAMRNYLLRLGWSHGDDEIISTEQAMKWFNLENIGRSPARFDFDKLDNLNGHYIRHTADQDLLVALQEIWNDIPNVAKPAREDLTEQDWALFLKAMPLLKERAKTLVELLSQALFLFAKTPLTLEAEAQKLLDADAKAHLKVLLSDLQTLENWSLETIQETVKNFAAQNGLKLGKIGPAIRAVLTGSTASPGIFDVMALLGKEEVLKRIANQI